MSKIQITADSICDLSPELIQKWNIPIVPLYINKDGESFRDMVDIRPEDIFHHFETTGELTKTSACTISDYIDVFRPIVEAGRQVIHVNISRHFSACYQNACAAASEFPEGSVYVVDSQNLSTGAGYVVVSACEMADSGMSADQIADALNQQVIPHMDSSFVINTLDYLHKGGRCSSVARLGANLLKLKPCIEVKNGKMEVGKKYRGAWDQCILKYVHERLENRTDVDTRRLFITYSSCPDKIVQQVHQQIQRILPFEQIVHTQAGCTISNHCGPNTLGIMFMRKA